MDFPAFEDRLANLPGPTDSVTKRFRWCILGIDPFDWSRAASFRPCSPVRREVTGPGGRMSADLFDPPPPPLPPNLTFGQQARAYLDLFLISFVGLFFGSACVRWLSGTVTFLSL